MARRRARVRRNSTPKKGVGWVVAVGVLAAGLGLGSYVYTHRAPTSSVEPPPPVRVAEKQKKPKPAPMPQPEEEEISEDDTPEDDGVLTLEDDIEDDPIDTEITDDWDDSDDAIADHEEAVEDEPEEEVVTPEEVETPTPTKPTHIAEVAPEVPYSEDCNLLGNSIAVKKQWQAWLQQLAEQKNLPEFIAAMETRIRNAVPIIFSKKHYNHNKYRVSEGLKQAVELCYIINMLGVEESAQLFFPKMKGEEDPRTSRSSFLHWALTDKSRPLHLFLRTFKLNAGEPENLPYAFNTFYSLWKRTPEKDRSKYVNLAIACSLLRKDIAERPSMLRNSTEPLLGITELYDFFCERDAKHRLITDIKKMSPSDLMHVVDVRLPMSEVEWVYKNLKYKRSDWGKSYGVVTYLMERATRNIDPYKTYTFAELKKEGGVCRDQAYFASATAKSRGIPAVYIVGDGDRGGHAWVAIMVNDHEWEEAGSVGYTSGLYTNPCSGHPMHLSMLLSRDKRMSEDKQDAAVDNMLLSDYLVLLGAGSEALGAASHACRLSPMLTSTWMSRVEVMKQLDEGEKRLSVNLWKRLHVELTRQAVKNKELLELAQEVEADYVLGGQKAFIVQRALRRSSRKMEKLMDSGRKDLVADGIARQAKIYVDGKDYRGLALLYKQQLKEYVNQADMFEIVLRQYYNTLHEVCRMRAAEQQEKEPDDRAEIRRKAEEKNMWKACARDANMLFSKVAFPSTDDFFMVQKHVSVTSLIAECFRCAGNEVKANKLVKDANKLLEISKEKAERNS